jgi:hypothetical protein
VEGHVGDDGLDDVADPEGVAQVTAMQRDVGQKVLDATVVTVDDPVEFDVLLSKQVFGEKAAGEPGDTGKEDAHGVLLEVNSKRKGEDDSVLIWSIPDAEGR